MKFWVQIDSFGKIKPLHNSDYEQFKKLQIDTNLHFEIKKKRNGKFHRKMFALFNLSFENQDFTDDFDIWRKALIIRAGFYITDPFKNKQAKSLSYSSMDDTEFSEVYDKMLDIISIQLGTKSETIRNELKEFE